MSVSFLNRPDGPDLAYRLQLGKNRTLPSLVFLGGFRSDMEGTKAAFLADACAKRDQTFLRFDYRGHGQSGGDFKDGTISLWLADALDVIRLLPDQKIILAGSSMGGWISLLIARAMPEKTAGMIGLAAAPDFTRVMKARMTDAQKAALAQDGYILVDTDYSPDPYKITRILIEDGEKNCLLDSPIAVRCPVRLLQGKKDTDVVWQTAQRISDLLETDDKKIYLQTEGDHRLSSPEDLALLNTLVEELSNGVCI